MSRDDGDAFASQVVQWLAALDVDAIQAHKDVRKALLDLVDRSETLRKEITTRLKANKTPIEDKEPSPIADFVAEHACSELASRLRASMTKGLGCLRSDLSRSIKEHCSSNVEELHDATANRQEKVMHRFRKHERTTIVTEGMRRLWLLRVSYEVDRLLPKMQHERTDKSDIAAAEREFSRLSGEAIRNVRKLRVAARPYLTLAKEKNGLGILLMLGSQSRDLWENRIGDEAIEWLWKFCKSNEEQVIKRAKALQTIACKTLLADFLDCDAHPHELREEGHVFSRHFKQIEACQDQPDGLRALVAAADVAVQDQIRLNDSGCAGDVSAQHPTKNSGLQPQFSEILTRMEGIEQQFFGPTPLSAEQTHDVSEVQTRDLHAMVSSPTAQQVESGMANYDLHEQNLSSLRRPCNQSWPQDPALPGSHIDPIMSLEIAQEGERNTNMESFWDWNNLVQETYAHLGEGFTG